jgi:hypothetical protein
VQHGATMFIIIIIIVNVNVIVIIIIIVNIVIIIIIICMCYEILYYISYTFIQAIQTNDMLGCRTKGLQCDAPLGHKLVEQSH